ncbi:MAG: glycoside hydrolase family 5 protein [Chloroflexi bacterium]|nr:glycoside hydrolase family 5 protein [Chloroflexota bacterium]
MPGREVVFAEKAYHDVYGPRRTVWMPLLSGLFLALLLGASLLAGGREEAPVWYTTRGAQILTPGGEPFLIHGLNRPSLEWNPAGVMLSRADVERMASWGINTVRIPTNQDFLLPDSCYYSPTYLATLSRLVRWIEGAGMEALIDLHWSDRGVSCPATMGQQKMPDVRSVRFWRLMAEHFRSDPHVFFDLYNEPHGVTWDCWLRGCTTDQGWTAIGMQELYNTVRAAGFRSLVFISGLDWARDLSGVPTHEVQGTNIVYATHPYYPTVSMSVLNAAFGSLTGRYPIVATEFGPLLGKTPFCSPQVEGGLINYFDAPDGVRAHHIGWIAWAWYAADNVCTFPAVISDWSGTVAPNGVPVRAALARYVRQR